MPVRFGNAGHALSQLNANVKLTINLSLTHATSEGFAMALTGHPLNYLVLGLTKNAVIADYATLQALLTSCLAAGMRLAIDDVGAKHPSFRRVINLKRELIKLDKRLIRHIDPTTRAEPWRQPSQPTAATFVARSSWNGRRQWANTACYAISA